TPGATDYRYFRLTLPDGTTSDTLDTTTLEAPQPTTKVDDIELIGGGAPRANGLDQAPMRVSVLDSLGQGIDPAVHADLYDRIYYRTATDALVTGLGNAQRPGRLFAVTQSGGQFSNTSIGMLASGSVPLYVSTNSLRSKEEFAAIIAPDSPEGDDGVEVVRSAAAAIGPQTKPLVGDGIAGSALSVANCVEGLCTLTEPTNTQPVLYRLSESTISLQLSTKGVHGALSLPLTDEQKGGAQRRLASSELVFNESSASTWLLQPEPFGPNATATASVVTHGELVTFESLYVSSR
ncbi:MAG: hypothetical protein K0R01_4116, partial [Mycobacterium sp.]|nr:hypothetical protein [Mycobacterium sp.]